MLHDEAEITVRSGSGGQGCVSFRREKFIPYGGPDGGDGGRGGDVIFIATTGLNSLGAFIRRRVWKAQSGRPGRGAECSGADGEDLVVRVPVGTCVRLAETGEIIADFLGPEQRVVVAAGGKGGYGNTHYKSSINQAPRQCGPGVPGTELRLKLDLKLIADAGIVGLPNAGKSTLLSRLSRAHPKIAAYPFTTLVPELGVLEFPSEERSLVLADIPGLIEGAAEGRGLGHRFLRHVERCPLLLHLIEIGDGEIDAIVDRYQTLDRELAAFDARLAAKPQLVILTKADTLPEDAAAVAGQVAERLGHEVLVVSAVSGRGLDELRRRLLALIPPAGTMAAQG